MSEHKHTAAPWAWREFGGAWHLVQDVGPRNVVLSTIETESRGDWDSPCSTVLAVRVGDPSRLVPLTPDHPDARLMAASPDLARELEETAAWVESMADELETIPTRGGAAWGDRKVILLAKLRARAVLIRSVLQSKL